MRDACSRPDILGDVTTEELSTLFLQHLWLPLVVTVLGGLILAGILAIFSKTVRTKFWRPFGRGLWWVTTLRVTTTKRMAERRHAVDAALQDAAAALAAEKRESARVRGVAAENIVRLQNELKEAREQAAREAAARESLHAKLTEKVSEQAQARGRTEGRAEAEAEVAAQRAALSLRPVWRIHDHGDGRFDLMNTQSGLTEQDVSDVLIAAPLGDFVFHGDSQWPGQFDGRVTFAGERMANGRRFGVTFEIRWRDRNGDWQTGQAAIDNARPRGGYVL